MSKKDDESAYGKDEGGKPEPKVVTEDKAFTESDGYKLNGLTLQPYTPEVMWAADAMGLRWGNLTPAAAKQFRTRRTYPGMEGDVGIVIWLMSLEDVSEVRAARRDPERAETEAIEFAMKHKIASAKQDGFWDAYEIFKQVMNQIHLMYGEPKKNEEAKKTVT